MRKGLVILAAMLPLVSGGCIGTAVSVVKAPFKAAGQAADWATTSQEEADRNAGRKLRKQEAREGRERQEHEKACKKDPENCGPYQGYRAGDPEDD
ncbi:hypothetical protein M9978_02740 [Sphingomonas sp. MG17]|uniref:Lipoprotein n=1 Tax=Sphingomonas tagetis TaxID=2949092 RepID=A0A9X2HN10_9SPHN|nr:hypothetical protein [Sphingomonas tagetis]MCP3729335.1 hypothetical protein [Sphingomonas tagetis]